MTLFKFAAIVFALAHLVFVLHYFSTEGRRS